MKGRMTVVVVAWALTACGGSTGSTGKTDGGAGAVGTAGSGGSAGGAGAPASGGTAGSPGNGGAPGSGGAGNGGSSGSGGAGNGGSSGSGGGPSACDPACGMSRECCTDHCVNPQNDPLNCGRCGKKCDAGTYCTGGQCVTVPCQATTCGTGTTCCGDTCCKSGELCCDSAGPISRGPVCETPTNGTCAMGCAPLCVCASPDTPIATPAGDRPIASLKVGDLVYSVDRGVITLAPIVRTNRSPVSGHHVVRTVLASGAVLEISPLHPTTDGRTFGGLHSGDVIDGVAVRSATLIPYAHDATYDILPGTDSGAYFAGGVLIGSTLAADAAMVIMPTAPFETASSRLRADDVRVQRE